MPSPNTHTFAANSLLTSYQVGTLLQVNPSSVNKWIKDGRIPAYRTPGGHRRIRATDLLAFLTQHKMPVPPGLLCGPKSRSVLAISDDPHVFDALKQSLEGHDGLRVTLARDGLDGLMRVGAESPDVVVLGPTRAPLDSLDICRRLRTTPKTQGVKIAVLRSSGGPQFEHDAKLAGADWVLALPVQATALAALVA